MSQLKTPCEHLNSISCMDADCHVILGQWYCTDCKKIWYYCQKCKKPFGDNQQDRDWHQWNCGK